jgi:hypothetical protein
VIEASAVIDATEIDGGLDPPTTLPGLRAEIMNPTLILPAVTIVRERERTGIEVAAKTGSGIGIEVTEDAIPDVLLAALVTTKRGWLDGNETCSTRDLAEIARVEVVDETEDGAPARPLKDGNLRLI